MIRRIPVGELYGQPLFIDVEVKFPVSNEYKLQEIRVIVERYPNNWVGAKVLEVLNRG